MKTTLLALFLGFFAQASYATGGFECSGNTNDGKKITLIGCVPYTIPSLCSDLTVLENDTELFVVPRNNVPSFFINNNFLGLIAMDEDFIVNLVELEYYGPKNKKNFLMVTSPAGVSYMVDSVICSID